MPYGTREACEHQTCLVKAWRLEALLPSTSKCVGMRFVKLNSCGEMCPPYLCTHSWSFAGTAQLFTRRLYEKGPCSLLVCIHHGHQYDG